MLQGCTSKYRTPNDGNMPLEVLIGDTYVRTISEALNVHNKIINDAVSQVVPLENPISEATLVILIPNQSDLEDYHDKIDPPAWNKAAQGYRDFFEYLTRNSYSKFADALIRRGMYKSYIKKDYVFDHTPPESSPDYDYMYIEFKEFSLDYYILLDIYKKENIKIGGDEDIETTAEKFNHNIMLIENILN